MKKNLIILTALLLLAGCNNKNIENTNNTELDNNKDIIENENIEEIKETYIDNNPITPGIYMYYNSYTDRKLLTEYTTNWQLNVDLCSLEIYYTNEPTIPGSNQKKLWNTYINNYENIDNYRIGYNIKFETKTKNINTTILSPKDTNDIYDYMQIYLYDDIHQKDGAWYSHITKEEFNDQSILSSIKLTGSTLTNDITSDITLTAFTYDEDDFDENNQYRGKSKSTITIKRS